MAYVEAHGRMFRVRVRMADRSLVTDSVFPLLGQAQDRAAEIDIAVRRGSSGYPRHPPASLSAWADMCAKSWLITPATRESYDGHLRRHILPALGELPLEVIDRGAVQEWIGRLREIMAPGSVHDVVKVLSLLMNAAMREGRIARNPCWQPHGCNNKSPPASKTMEHQRRPCARHGNREQLAAFPEDPSLSINDLGGSVKLAE